jgi:hypothetical protein
MNIDNIIGNIVAILSGLALIAMSMYYGYLAWFFPGRFRRNQLEYTKNAPVWWPFRSAGLMWVKSRWYLWFVRITTLVVLLISLVIGFAIMLAFISGS